MKYPDDFINKIICGDCLEVMKEMPESSVDAIVCDPPYGLEFMGKEWDKLWTERPEKIRRRQQGHNDYCDSPKPCYKAGLDGQLWHIQWLTEAYRVLKPGGSMLVMGGTRTSHRLACAIEDSGFIIKDTLIWLYGSGFPKAQELSTLVDAKILGISTKEVRKRREVISRNPNSRENCDKSNTLYESGTVGKTAYVTKPLTPEGEHWDGFKVGTVKPAYEPIIWAVKPPEGSYVDNVLKWGVGAVNVDECRVGLNGMEIHKTPAKSGLGKKGIYGKSTIDELIDKDLVRYTSKGRFPANVILDEKAGKMLDEQSGNRRGWSSQKHNKFNPYGGNALSPSKTIREGKLEGFNDSGGASRFFYCAKASKSERGEKNKHPTVKPIALFMWLIQLVTREEQLILDPFVGSGTTMLASQGCNRKCVGIEKDKDYCKIAEERLTQGVL